MQAVIGVDPHKQVFCAVALDERGAMIGHWQGGTNRQGIKDLQRWAADCAPGATSAIEGANSLGRSLALTLIAVGADVRDLCPTRTADRRRKLPGRGKSDAVDAEAIPELLAHRDLPYAFKTTSAQRPRS